LAQGVIWSQRLHRRDPQLNDVPESLANTLQQLLQAIAIGSAAKSKYEESAVYTQDDELHSNSSQMYALVREIRALPGLDRFMLGETFETLRTAADDHPVVVLVGDRHHHYALIMDSSFPQGQKLILLDLNDENWTNLLLNSRTTRTNRTAATCEETLEEGDRAGINKTGTSSLGPRDGQLRTLWHKIVKPVIDHLGLKASDLSDSNV
jgi:hypothetical protein